MANEQNLIPGAHKLTVEEASRGGVESGKTRRLQGALKRALQSAATSAEFKEVFDAFNLDESDRNYAAAIACAIVRKAANGDLSAASFVRDSTGEKPKDEISLDGGVVIVDDLAGKT